MGVKPPLPFINVKNDFYWSSTFLEGSTTKGWMVAASNGATTSYFRNENHYVWPVKGD